MQTNGGSKELTAVRQEPDRKIEWRREGEASMGLLSPPGCPSKVGKPCASYTRNSLIYARHRTEHQKLGERQSMSHRSPWRTYEPIRRRPRLSRKRQRVEQAHARRTLHGRGLANNRNDVDNELLKPPLQRSETARTSGHRTPDPTEATSKKIPDAERTHIETETMIFPAHR